MTPEINEHRWCFGGLRFNGECVFLHNLEETRSPPEVISLIWDRVYIITVLSIENIYRLFQMQMFLSSTYSILTGDRSVFTFY